MGDGDGHFAQGFIGGFLAREAHGVGSAFGVVTKRQFKGAVGFVGLVEELGLRLAALQGCEHGSDIRKPPFHGDFVVPVELFVAALGRGIDEKGGFGGVETEA